MKASEYTIVASGIHKSFNKGKKEVKVLEGIDFKVKRGTVLALLGPNGAGKTTTVRILTTLLNADAGKAIIEGYDVRKQPDEVRAVIGLTGQYAAVDEYLTGRENLFMMGRLYHLSTAATRARTEELLTQFDLNKAADRPTKTYSGGMRRRLDLAMSLIASPPIIFLDEPTTGLDPRSRLAMWAMIKKLVENGTTILLTTQYMDEADHLANDIVVIDNGKVIAEGTPSQLKAKVGSDRLELTISPKSNFKKAQSVITSKDLQADAERRVLSLATKGGVDELKQVLQVLQEAGIGVDSVELRRPTLDDVFLTLTGHGTAKPAEDTTKKEGK